MRKEIRCPYCNTSLIGANTIVREIKIEDNDWLGIENGRLINTSSSIPQPSYTDMRCFKCNSNIQEYIDTLLDEETIDE